MISAYACEPHKGSEPGVGWNVATEVAKVHDVWVLTRKNNRTVIEAELKRSPVPGLQFIYYDLPKWAYWWKRGDFGIQWYYYLWQLLSWKTVRQAHRELQFDLTHHVTLGKYWAPSVLARLPVPFVWGVVGGGESMPPAFFADVTWRERGFEVLRNVARRTGEHDLYVRKTVKKCSLALAATNETAARLNQLGCGDVRVVPQCALTRAQLARLSALPPPSPESPLRFISIGRPLHWKGFYLGIKAFAAANLADAEYWIIANGSGRSRLETLAKNAGVGGRVRFFDPLPTLNDVYGVLSQCHVLVHPALHEAFGNVVLEAMAAARPVIALDIGGPVLQLAAGSGFAASSSSPSKAIEELKAHMLKFAENRRLSFEMGQTAAAGVVKNMTWDSRIHDYLNAYNDAVRHHENHPDS